MDIWIFFQRIQHKLFPSQFYHFAANDSIDDDSVLVKWQGFCGFALGAPHRAGDVVLMSILVFAIISERIERQSCTWSRIEDNWM